MKRQTQYEAYRNWHMRYLGKLPKYITERYGLSKIAFDAGYRAGSRKPTGKK